MSCFRLEGVDLIFDFQILHTVFGGFLVFLFLIDKDYLYNCHIFFSCVTSCWYFGMPKVFWFYSIVLSCSLVC